MRTFVHKLTGLLLLVVFLGGSGLVGYYAAGPTGAWHDALASIEMRPLTVCCGAAVIFLSVSLYLLTGVRRRERDRYLSFPGDGGTVRVNLKGMASHLVKLANEFDSIKAVSAHIVAGDRSMDASIDVKIKEGVQVHEVSELLRERIRESIRESLGITDVRNVDVNVREIVQQRRMGA
jgi:uncharacterized alkaline shock family protein YloU